MFKTTRLDHVCCECGVSLDESELYYEDLQGNERCLDCLELKLNEIYERKKN